MAKTDLHFDPTNLKKLFDESKLTQDQIDSCSKGINIANYLYGKSVPSLSVILKLADIFAVPLDYLVGRCTKEECDAIEESFADNFRLLRKEAYEELILRSAGRGYLKPGYEAPYPYNLIDNIFNEPVDHILSEDEVDGLNAALLTLTEREYGIIKYRYQDEMSLKEVSAIYHVGQERIRQIEAKALRKLRHPSRSKMILYGSKAYQRKMELRDKELELRYREKELERKEKLFVEKVHEIETEKQIELEKLICQPGENNDPEIFSMSIEELDLDVRSFNCLKRQGLNTLGDIIEKIRDGSIIKVRNLGVKSIENTIEQIRNKTGMSFNEIAGDKELNSEMIQGEAG